MWLYHSTSSFNFTTTSQEQIRSFVSNPQVKLCDLSKPYGFYKCQMQITNHERPTWVKTFLKFEARAQGHTNKDREGRVRCFVQSAFNSNMQVKRLSNDAVPMQVKHLTYCSAYYKENWGTAVTSSRVWEAKAIWVSAYLITGIV